MATVAVGVAVVAEAAWAQTKAFDVPAQPAATGLAAFARQADVQVLVSANDAQGRRTNAVRGAYPVAQALRLLLDNTGLVAQATGPQTWTIVRVPSAEAAAEPIAASEPQEIAELVVTAQPREERLRDVPMSIAAVTQRELERRGVETLLDLSRAAPGLVVTESGPGQNRIFLRGIGNGTGLTSLVGVYVDEMPVTGMALGQLDLRLVDLERVEVLRGPQGTLYGQGSAGGTVRLITREPDLDAFSGRADVQGYTTAHGSLSGEATGVLNLPLVTGQLGLRLSGTFAEIGGWIDQPNAGRDDINDQRLRNVRGKLLWTPDDRLRVVGTITIHRNEGDGVNGGADPDHVVRYVNDPAARPAFRDDYELYNGLITYDFGPVRLLSSTSYLESEKRSAGLQLNLGAVRTFNRDSQDNEVFTQEVRLSSSDNGPVKWIAGAFYDSEILTRVQVVDVFLNGAPIAVQRLPVRNKTRSISLFGDASYEVTDRLTIGAGVRSFRDRRNSFNNVLFQKDTFKSTDPRVYGTYALTPEVKLYANVAKGFRSGGFSGDPTGQRFQPEDIWSYEAGLKGAFSNGLRLELTAFYSEYKNIQAFALTSGVTGGTVNVGEAHPKGIDWLVGYESRRLSLVASGNVTRAKFNELLPATRTYQVGDRVDLIPSYSVTLSAEYRLDWREDLPGFVRIDFNQVGPSSFTDRRSGVIGFRSDTISLLNARVGADSGPWRVEAFATNLLDEHGLQDPLAGLGFGARPRPRVFGLKAGMSF